MQPRGRRFALQANGKLEVEQLKSESPEASAKTQVKEYKESLIIEAAVTLFYERGFDRTTLDDIAAALGVTKPFIYTYFKSKYNLLERLFDRVFDAFQEDINQFKKFPERDPVRRFEFFISTYVRSNLERQDFMALILKEERNLSPEKVADIRMKKHGFDRLLESLVAEGVRAGVFEVKDAALASLAVSGMVVWMHRWYTPGGRLTVEQLCSEMTTLALRLVGYLPAITEGTAPTTSHR